MHLREGKLQEAKMAKERDSLPDSGIQFVYLFVC
jgi:hypothetical protein